MTSINQPISDIQINYVKGDTFTFDVEFENEADDYESGYTSATMTIKRLNNDNVLVEIEGTIRSVEQNLIVFNFSLTDEEVSDLNLVPGLYNYYISFIRDDIKTTIVQSKLLVIQ
jgi:hypothetical protein